MRAVCGARTGLLSRRGAYIIRERAARRSVAGGTVALHALILGGSRSGKSSFAEDLAETLGGERVLYVATATTGEDADLERRVRAHRERRPAAWATLELGGGDLAEVIGSAQRYRAVLLDSLTLWVSARISEGVAEVLAALDDFLERAGALSTPLVVVSDEVGMGVVPESASGRQFRDALGLANGRAAAVAGEVYLCVAGIPVRLK